MALSQHDLQHLLESLQAADDLEMIRAVLERMLQELIEAEATAAIGAEPHQRTPERTNRRNGHRERALTTTSGDVDLKIPKLRSGSFFPCLLERRRRIDRALFAVIMQAYVHGVSTRAVDDLVKALGADTGISKSQVSRICADLDTEVEAFAQRPLDHTPFPYVFLDATYCKARQQHRICSAAVVIATGVSAEGRREVLGLAVGDSESRAFWTEFLRSLRARGLGGVLLVVSDAHAGLVAAVQAVFIGAAWQRCRVHFVRDVLARVPRGSGEMVAATIRTIFAQENAQAVREHIGVVAELLKGQFPQVQRMLLEAAEDITAFAAFPVAHWKKIWSTNPLERLNREVKRRADVVQVFPDRKALHRLAGAVLAEMHDEWQVSDRRYLAEASMAELYRGQGPPGREAGQGRLTGPGGDTG
ncbi:IS256 family transposase [Nocardiopsis sp. RSe5-2]|uniref:Mutator family transposase n=1 Tax=Nocardiopsis endophytica TaxID=3018445 RepID=A0ABT4UEX0_9ACTN|nr:IS256 family transposase [Nocardiopsis endophytica]MDA2815301.1 IS256 family transposase [Nocardiopsis endophytica]